MATADEEAPCLRIVRRFDVPPENVFDALTNPDDMRVWSGDNVTFDINLQVGGRWTIVRRFDGVECTATGEYLAIDRPNLVRYTYAMPQFSPNSDTVNFEVVPDGSNGCLVTFVQSGPDIADELRNLAPGDTCGSSEAGWQKGFDMMAAAWSAKPPPSTEKAIGA
jgi:uncharacterized protein YndB with AHSA1/START domain